MSKAKKAIKEANKLADKEIRLAEKNRKREAFVKWLKSDVKGVKNWHLVALVLLTLSLADVLLLNP